MKKDDGGQRLNLVRNDVCHDDKVSCSVIVEAMRASIRSVGDIALVDAPLSTVVIVHARALNDKIGFGFLLMLVVADLAARLQSNLSVEVAVAVHLLRSIQRTNDNVATSTLERLVSLDRKISSHFSETRKKNQSRTKTLYHTIQSPGLQSLL